MYGRTSHNLDGTHFHQYGKQSDHNFSISRNLLNNLLIEAAKEVPGIAFFFGHALKTLDVTQ